MVKKPESLDEIVITMLPGPGKNSGINPISGKSLKTLETFNCTYEQAFGKGIAAEVMRGLTIPKGFDFYFRPYNDARVLGFLRKPNNLNTFKYFLGKASNCKNDNQLFVNEIINNFTRENKKRENDIFHVELGKTNWGTLDATENNKDDAIRVINKALVEIADRYGIDGNTITTEKPNFNKSESEYLPTEADCEIALKTLRKSKKGSSVSKEDLFDWLKRHFKDKGISMKNNWKVITERNLNIWFG